MAVVATHAACAAGPASVGQKAGPTITEADIERARREQPKVTDQDIEEARRKYRMPGGVELQSAPIPPRIDALPQPHTSAPIDLEALARGYASQSDAMEVAQGLINGPGLFVFISLAMPRPTLQRLIDQAERARASVILRGFVSGSLRETVAQVQMLIGQRKVAIQIDPQAFDRFAISRVPSFVLVRDGARPVSCAAGTCATPEAFLLASGDVSLDYALDHMRRTVPAFRTDADTFLARLRH
ncbi:type-F conjugative transfer system pilin assembly protein TrbC [Burkholderia vietnamiensis]|uniref:type-F conjugative transfer system pilin assembly protein TrbC n=1 Tax=Burkholderia vietnamiensis TaxID=60552 RepID=UPI001D158F69|nr:type-F conjugative transfer system pilin assembly protein TrbC [Burkholderia vietnamiensis]UEC01782.1 type-F conjugative transfer system pilin assembly protein TrbC [Burkholderia vietnamiensis]